MVGDPGTLRAGRRSLIIGGRGPTLGVSSAGTSVFIPSLPSTQSYSGAFKPEPVTQALLDPMAERVGK